MKHIGKALLRWLYTAALYALFYFTFDLLMGSGLRGAGMSPFGYSQPKWILNCHNLLLNTLFGSLALTAIWNLLFSWRLLGGRNPRGSVNVLGSLFLAAHILMSIALLFLHTAARGVVQSILTEGGSYILWHVMPTLLIIPFFFAVRLLGPESAAYRFRLLNKLRGKIGLLYY